MICQIFLSQDNQYSGYNDAETDLKLHNEQWACESR